ncbi:sodium ion-translocating decarboxylase subunit beta [Cellvibrio japonicus]|uniref:Oxaloacetate decarboxylase beta chain n=1 Tax=Cellvibrio japonicus (strain Ueda107) TaxID=498211 RepID=B3PBJ1_CELJU|nr:sodium ion-translocating decarboxylase subunit beta [Cellvibrio japonicus]ACE84634.1 oxaloacetate decarboxylase beta chain [Cellvibrio japonicus Ueda107]QEI13105.1 sodium ion-translocating decarboxylase subunit beta [Cellvibrio japonicus]QEI16679.1 sodium ion-translocating decarboxylase subunit beta [Cellvibrio japonicus]QEI20257.1 sodium ion-translocating decarboxylase subunit beta [Cellvibrio japonicus]
MESLLKLWTSTGIYNMQSGQLIMIGICLVLLFLAIRKGFEPLLLVPIGFGGLLANLPAAGMAFSAIEQALHNGTPEIGAALAQLVGLAADTPDGQIYKALSADPVIYQTALHMVQNAGYGNGMLYTFYTVAIASGIAPLVIFIGVGAMTDFGPLLANPKTLLLGAAAQFGIFATVLGAIALGYFGLDFSIADAAAIGIIGGADGPTAIYVASKLAPDLLGAIAVAAYSYMALVPLIQPPIMRLLTTKAEREIVMTQLRVVGKREKIAFPVIMLVLVGLLLPDAAPLLGAFCLGNLMRECGVVDRLSDTAQNALINITTLFLGLAVGSKLAADKFLDPKTLGILALGIMAFGLGTAAGVIMAKIMNLFSKHKVNPLIGSAGVSAVPMAARVSNKLGLQANPQNYLLMHAMGPNVAGVIGSAVAAGVMISIVSSLPAG